MKISRYHSNYDEFLNIKKRRTILISESHYCSNINVFKRHIQLDKVFVVDVL